MKSLIAGVVHISRVTMVNTTFIKPHIRHIINTLDDFRYDSQIGGFLKTISICGSIDENKIGKLADYCIKIILDPYLYYLHNFYLNQDLIQ